MDGFVTALCGGSVILVVIAVLALLSARPKRVELQSVWATAQKMDGEVTIFLTSDHEIDVRYCRLRMTSAEFEETFPFSAQKMRQKGCSCLNICECGRGDLVSLTLLVWHNRVKIQKVRTLG